MKEKPKIELFEPFVGMGNHADEKPVYAAITVQLETDYTCSCAPSEEDIYYGIEDMVKLRDRLIEVVREMKALKRNA